MTVAQLKSAILNSVDPIPSLAGKTITGGRVNVCRAMPGCSAPAPTPTAPGAPALSATAGNATVRLQWTTPASGGSVITNYNIYRGTTSGAKSLLATLGTATSFDDNAVTNGTTYYYVVKAVNSIGEGVASNEVAALPKMIAAPAAPALTARTASGKGIQLNWTVPDDGGSPITAYRIYRSTTSAGETLLTTAGR